MFNEKADHIGDSEFDYAQEAQRMKSFVVVLSAFCAFLVMFDLYITCSFYMTFKEFLQALFTPDNVEKYKYLIVQKIQLPIALMGLFCGASLGITGAVMQTMLNNPLASPYTLGISAGASLGASLAMTMGISSIAILGIYLIPGMAFFFALIACGVIFMVAKVKQFSADVLILAGIGLVFLFQAVRSLIEYFVDAATLKNVIFWTMGSLENANWVSVPIIATLFIIVLCVVYKQTWKLTVMRLGDTRARALGVDVMRMRKVLFVLVSLLTACCVAFVGTIGFVGIVGPHIARMIVGEDQRYLLISSGLVGAVMLESADIISKVISPGTVYPIGIITAIIGIPFFFSLLIRKKSGEFW